MHPFYLKKLSYRFVIFSSSFKIIAMKEIKVGNTPLVALKGIEDKYNLKAHLFAKVESFNPAGSVKDRIAYKMIMDAKEKGLVKEDTTFIEPTSGNTGIAIAYMAKALGYKAIIVMPESMTIERRQKILSFGAELVLTEASKGMKGSIEKANELLKEIPNSLILGQFDNMANPKAHYETTGPEIYKQSNGSVDIFVAGVGTGGTISGAGKYLKEQKNVKVVAVEPLSSAVLSGSNPGKHKIQGIGAGFIPNTLNTAIYDEIYKADDLDAIKMAMLVKEVENIGVGISSGAALLGAINEAKKKENEGKNIVLIFPDGEDRYNFNSLI